MKKILLMFGVFLTIFLVGCAQTQVDVVQPETKEPVKIGFLMGMTGPIASIADGMKKALDLGVEEVNFAGGINGRPVEIIVEDDKCAPKEGATGVQKLIDQDNVVAIVGAGCSSATLAAAPIAEQAGVVMVSPSSTNPTIKDSGQYIFRVVPSDALQGKVGAQMAKEWGIKKAAVLYINNDYGLALGTVFKDEFKAKGGEVTTVETFEQDATDFRTELTKIKGSNPELLYLVALPQQGGQILKQIKELGINARLLASEAIKDPEVLTVAGEAANGITVTIPKPNKDANYKAFEDLFKAKYGEEVGLFHAETYDAFKIIVTALKNSDGSRTGVKDALYKIKDFPGASGKMTFDANGEVEKEISSVKVADGKFVEG